jgi:hypothetical protein
MGIQNVLGSLLMLYSQISTLLRQRGELLLSGQIDQMIYDFVYPLPVFLQSNRLLITAPDHARLIFGHLRAALVARGVVLLRPKISAIDLPRGGRFRVWVDWQEIAFPAEASRISQAIYYCRTTELGLQTEMLNYTHLSMPELNQQFQALAMSA